MQQDIENRKRIRLRRARKDMTVREARGFGIIVAVVLLGVFPWTIGTINVLHNAFHTERIHIKFIN